MAQRRERSLYLASLFAIAALAGCAGAPPKQEEATFLPAEVPAAAAPDTTAATDAKPASQDELTADQKAQMEIALRRGGEKATNCAKVVPDGPRGEGEVKVTFDGKKGRATEVTVGPPWAGTDVESCIKRSFIGEIIVPFDGDLEVPYTVKLPPKAEEPGKPGKPGAKPAAKDPKK